ncbi:MAG: NUDIX hydrolase [Planctomycetes bacterium]|nr:NUDIX hydrolase [Planctomycetota bacterium]
MPFTYDYPRPAVTVDTVLCTTGAGGDLRVLLIRRKHEPGAGCWALPGGFVDEHEDLPAAARRELSEETGITVRHLVQLGAYGAPGRDPRGHTVGIAFLALLAPGAVDAVAGDDAAACGWFSLRRPPRLAFDHGLMLRDARRRLAELAREATTFRRLFGGGDKANWLAAARRAAR